ncbi:MAG: PAS domain S-box protein [Deltaproteobacteria bacterium]|nr:PAS domain S-box protein [Deltaproteobacteria bacterium]
MELKNIINPRSLSGTGFLSILITILIIAPTIGSFWVFSEYNQKKEELVKIKEQYTRFYKTRLLNDINNVINFIDYKKSNTETRVKTLVKERVHHAYSLASHIYTMDKFKEPGEKIKSKIIETLRPIRWDNGRGYFFILNYDGFMVLNADLSEMEGKDTKKLKDINGKSIIKDMVSLARKNDSGFYRYKWSKPDSTGNDHVKITYVKNFKPLNLVICAGFYLEDMEANIKKEILNRVAQLTDHKDQYIFVFKKDGFCLSHPLKKYYRKNIINHTAPDGRKIVRELIDVSNKKGGGYITYPWEKPSTGKIADKLSYAVSVKDWGWTIGTGVYLDEVAKTIETEKKLFKKTLKRNVLIIMWFFFLVVILALILGFFITNRLDQGINVFTIFFQKAADSDIKINEKMLIFKEFKLLGRLANQMVEDRIEKEKALRKAMRETVNVQNLLKNITDSMPSSLVAIDQDMKVIQWNKKVENATGITARNAEGKQITDVFPLTEKELALIETTFKEGCPCTQTRVVKIKENEQRHEDITIYPLITNNTKGAVIRIDDTTEKVRIEEMMIQSEKMLSIGGLAAGMAHEINNPLSGIIGNTDVLKNRLLKDLPMNINAAKKAGTSFNLIRKYAEERGLPLVLENIRKAGSRAATIVSDMLSFSRMSSSAFSPCDIASLLDKTIELASTSYNLKKKFDFKKISIKRFYNQNMPLVMCESSKIQQVFLNILSNGAHAMSETLYNNTSPEFTLKLDFDRTYAIIHIGDNGPGIPEDIRKRIFEPFFTTKEIGIGTGLGLSVSYFIITDHHRGTMEVESKVGVGTSFIIKLPINQ